MMTFLATFLASLLDPIAFVLCFIAGALIRRHLIAAAVGGVIFIALLALISSLPKVAAVLAGRFAAGAIIAWIGSLVGRKFWPRKTPA
ncbi:hypothetical protein LU642_29420 [Pseudomonas asiatica]|uniref:hypothetical protein n=1 Tax=Pseudomonas asiatica TaxID=2219225 RepID=UPI001E621858|nr:hypothetical protein [Pseudomonas asiatica]MCE1084703.1 hypothetical protein [Pseudomonas asiatica]